MKIKNKEGKIIHPFKMGVEDALVGKMTAMQAELKPPLPSITQILAMGVEWGGCSYL